MVKVWTEEERAILKSMREAGCDWDEISEATGHPEQSCRSRAGTDDVRKWAGRPLQHHRGIVQGRVFLKKQVMRPCIGCKKMFKSWDRTKNQRCDKCRQMTESNIFF